MVGFSEQNGTGSPASVALRKATNSPKSDIGEIDTRAPFQSVKAAVSLFGEVGSPTLKSVTKKSKAEERVLEKETQHQMILKELDNYKDLLKTAETAKAQTLKEQRKANTTFLQLTKKLETLTESKQAAKIATEAAKVRAQELEKKKILRAQLGSDAWKLDVEREKEGCKATAGELVLTKRELVNLRRDFEAALEGKMVASREAEEVEKVVRVSQERQSKLMREVAEVREALNQIKCGSEEERSKVAEKEALLVKYRSKKEEAAKETKDLEEQHGPAEKLKEKLEEMAEAVRVLQDLQAIVLELDSARKALQEVAAEEDLIISSVDPIKIQLEEVKRKRLEYETKAVDAETAVQKMRDDLEKRKSELELQPSLEKLSAQAEKSRKEAEEAKNNAELLKQEAEASRMAAKKAEEKLLIALKQCEEAKAAEKLADDQIYNSLPIRKIRLSIEEFDLMNKKIEESNNRADVEVATARAEMESVTASEKKVLQEIEAILKKNRDIESEIIETLQTAEMAETAKRVVEGELRKRRQKQQNNKGQNEFGAKSFISMLKKKQT